jgi:hypothetical protein
MNRGCYRTVKKEKLINSPFFNHPKQLTNSTRIYLAYSLIVVHFEYLRFFSNNPGGL